MDDVGVGWNENEPVVEGRAWSLSNDDLGPKEKPVPADGVWICTGG